MFTFAFVSPRDPVVQTMSMTITAIHTGTQVDIIVSLELRL